MQKPLCHLFTARGNSIGMSSYATIIPPLHRGPIGQPTVERESDCCRPTDRPTHPFRTCCVIGTPRDGLGVSDARDVILMVRNLEAQLCALYEERQDSLQAEEQA